MIIDDKFRDENLQYNINREATNTLALSSGKIDKYEYLTGEEIIPSNQSRVIEQAKFTYSLLGKAFEKQIKTIENQGEKQIKALEEHGKQLVRSNAFAEKEKQIMLLDKQKEIFYNFAAERTGEIEKLHNSVTFQNLVYHYKGPIKDIDFNDFIEAETLFDNIKSKKKSDLRM